tara:strand:- start:1036 stop:1842 length:807 start_codon:yes stop_codon:yes gene_type:complete
MAYLPENKYKILYTNGKKYRLKATKRPYVGKYIQLSNGKVFAGDHPSRIIGPLISIEPLLNRNILNKKNNNIYSILKPKLAAKQNTSIPIPTSTPYPSALDYSKGYFIRFFSVRLNTKQYQEISKSTFDDFYKRNYDKSLNKIFQIEWSLNENNEEQNTKKLRSLNYQLPGIFNFFPDKGQYGLVWGVVRLKGTTRVYPTGESIPKILPAAYQIGNSPNTIITNYAVPLNQHCGNCIFNQNGYCNWWKANIKNQYWCRAYKSKVDSEE